MAFDNVIIDLSHHNGKPSFKQASANGVLGVIHKATQGATGMDPMYTTNCGLAQTAGLLWGAYHFGTGEDGVTQAEHFLNTVNPSPGTILALDFEENPNGSNMTLEDARDFIVHVQQATGIYPGLYGGNYLKTQLGSTVDPTLQQCWLWLAQYGPTAAIPPCWPAWTVWQYTDGAHPKPHAIPGIGFCDQDCYNGTAADLTTAWNNGSLS